ncbi:hypothetical protein HDV05_002513 [Chytridiales sp. JEL 0842]|nr:hypothetical protein HDV05_002513 [Chytridiales sp. JEL 0842]
MLALTALTAFLALANARLAVADREVITIPTDDKGPFPFPGNNNGGGFPGTRPPPGGSFPPPSFPPGNGGGFPGGNNPGQNEVYCNGYSQYVTNALFNTDVYGFDLNSFYSEDYCSCERYCSQDNRCDFFVFNRNQCSLKTLENRFSNTLTWFRTNGGGSALIQGDFNRNDFGRSIVTDSREQCIDQCAFNECNVATMVPFGNRQWSCYLKRVPSQSFGSVLGVNNRGQRPAYPATNPGGPYPPPGPGPYPPPGPGPFPPGNGGQCKANLLPQGYDLPGYDLAYYDSPSTCYCEQLCRQNQNCDFYVTRGRNCYLKSLQRKFDSYYTWFKTQTCQGGSSLLRGSIDSYDVSQPFYARNIQECQNACYNNPSCLFVVIQQADPRGGRVYCNLKSPQRAGYDFNFGVVDRDGVNRFCNNSNFRGLESETTEAASETEAETEAAVPETTTTTAPAVEVEGAAKNGTDKNNLIALSFLLASSVTAQFPGFPGSPGGGNPQNPPVFCNGAPTFAPNILPNIDIFPFDAPVPPTFVLDFCSCNSICASNPTTCDFFVYRPSQNQCVQKQLLNRESGAFSWFYTNSGGSALLKGELPGYDVNYQQTNSREECTAQAVFQGGNAATMLPIDNGVRWQCFIKRLPNENPSQPGSIMGTNNKGAPPVSPAGPQQCTGNLMPNGFDIQGFDLWSGVSPSNCFCENQCRLRPQCDFFIQRFGSCWVKTLQRKQDNVFTWFKTQTCQGGSSFLRGTIDGFDIATTQVNNVQECQQQCRANRECLYISVQPVNPGGGPLFCFLKRILPNALETVMGIVDRDVYNPENNDI